MKIIDSNEFEEILSSGKKFVIDFYANWCGPCRALSPILEEISSEIDIYKVNVDESSDLAREYGIMSIPCLILFDKGSEQKKIIGLKDKETLLDWIKTK